MIANGRPMAMIDMPVSKHDDGLEASVNAGRGSRIMDYGKSEGSSDFCLVDVINDGVLGKLRTYIF